MLLAAFAISTHYGSTPLRAQTAPDALTFFKNYFITGDYKAAGVGLRGAGADGLAAGSIVINGVPADADIVSAFLYWQVVSDAGSDTGSVGVEFNGYPLRTPEGEPLGKELAVSGTAPCFNPGDSTGEGESLARTYTYRADVLRFFEVNPVTGKLAANGSHLVKVPDSGPNGNNSPMALGASLVVVYRDPSMPLNAIVIYDDGVTLDNSQRTVVQTLAGFYQASTSPNASISYIVGSGQAAKHENVVYPGGKVASPFAATSGASWDNITYAASLPANASQATTTVTTDVQTPGGSDCLTIAAIVFKTAVQDTDGDGLLDVWETATTPLLDPNGRALPLLSAMGANPFRKDLFIEVGHMETDATSYGGAPRPAHSHRPTPEALRLVGEAFNNGPQGGVAVHFDVGSWIVADYPVETRPFLVPSGLARGGEAINESVTVCEPGEGAPLWECQFSAYPGTVGWKTGFRFLRDEVLSVTPPAGEPVPPVGEEFCDAAGYTCNRRFDPNRKDMFHYALFAHAVGLPKSEYPCRVPGTNPPTLMPAGDDDRCGAGTETNPDFLTPRTNTGIGDFPGGDLMVTLGAFLDSDNLTPVGTPYMQASTLMHELGHNFERRHGGEPSELNCRPAYLSVMNYLYQLRGLLDDAGDPHLGFSDAFALAGNLTIDEAGLADGAFGGLLPYRLGWYAPLVGSYLDPVNDAARLAAAAKRHCDGTPIQAGEPLMVRVDAFSSDTTAQPIDWNANGVQDATGAHDANFNGVSGDILRGSDDWSNLRLNQLGSRRSPGGLYHIYDDAGRALGLGVGPLSLDAGKGDLGKGDLGKGDLGKGDLGKGDLGKGDLGKGDLGKGDLGKGDLGKGDLGTGDLFGDEGEIDAELARELARTPPNRFAATVLPSHYVTLTWNPPNIGGVAHYTVYRVRGATLLPLTTVPPQPRTEVGQVLPGSALADGSFELIDSRSHTLVRGEDYTYYATATYTDGVVSDVSRLATIRDFDNAPPAISVVADQALFANGSTAPLAFTVADAETDAPGAGAPAALSVSGTVTSAIDGLAAEVSLAFSGTGTNRTVTVTHAGTRTGSATVTLTVADTQCMELHPNPLTPLAGCTPGTASSSFTVTIAPQFYTFVGIQNVPPPPAKTFKAGSAIPMRWQFTSGSTVVNSSAVQHQVRVRGPLPNGPIREYTNTAPGNSSFRYNATTNTWQFNLQTKESNGTTFATGTYEVTITPLTPGYQPSQTFTVTLAK